MHSYRLIFKEQPPSFVTFEADDAAEAFRHAQSHNCPAELWADDHKICTIGRTGVDGEIWVISGAARRENNGRRVVSS
jgi:hypothetical protein